MSWSFPFNRKQLTDAGKYLRAEALIAWRLSFMPRYLPKDSPQITGHVQPGPGALGWWKSVLGEEAPGLMLNVGVGPKREVAEFRAAFPELFVAGCDPDPEVEKHLRTMPEYKRPHFFLGVALGEAQPGPTWKQSRILYLERVGRASFHKTPYHVGPSIEVEAMTLDVFHQRALVECVAREHRHWPILLWMDAQGAEAEILRSGPELLANGDLRWLNIEETFAGEERATRGWAHRTEIEDILSKYGFRRVLEYAHQDTHWDVIWQR